MFKPVFDNICKKHNNYNTKQEVYLSQGCEQWNNGRNDTSNN